MNSIYLNREELEKNIDSFKILIDGKKCKNINHYFKEVLSKFKLKYSKKFSLCDYLDLMCEASTFNSDNISFVIYNYHEFLKTDLKIKEFIISTFKYEILPFGDNLENLNMQKKNFNLYLIEESGL
jgi:hypothetical protein